MYKYRTKKRPVLFQESGFWFVQDPVRFVPSTYVDPQTIDWEHPKNSIKWPEVKQLQYPSRLCGSWLSGYVISRFLIARDWFRPDFERAHKLAQELCGHGPIRPIVKNDKIIGYEVRRHPRWAAAVVAKSGFSARLGARENVGYVHAKYVRHSTRGRAQIARGLYWFEEKCQPVRRFFLELRRPVA